MKKYAFQAVLDWLRGAREGMRQGAVNRQAPLEQKIAEAIAGRQQGILRDYGGRSDDSMAPVVASYLSKQGDAADPDYQQVVNLLRLQGMGSDVAQASPDLIRSAMGQLESDQARQALLEILAATQARQGYGPVQAVRQAELGINQAMGRDDWVGDVSRAGVVSGAIGGGVLGVAGLTAAGQQLMALMDNMQQENENATKRNQELTS